MNKDYCWSHFNKFSTARPPQLQHFTRTPSLPVFHTEADLNQPASCQIS